MKKLIIFDLDGTLAPSKGIIDPEMGTLLTALLAVVKVAIISGGGWGQFETQVLGRLPQGARIGNLSKFYQLRERYSINIRMAGRNSTPRI